MSADGAEIIDGRPLRTELAAQLDLPCCCRHRARAATPSDQRRKSATAQIDRSGVGAEKLVAALQEDRALAGEKEDGRYRSGGNETRRDELILALNSTPNAACRTKDPWNVRAVSLARRHDNGFETPVDRFAGLICENGNGQREKKDKERSFHLLLPNFFVVWRVLNTNAQPKSSSSRRDPHRSDDLRAGAARAVRDSRAGDPTRGRPYRAAAQFARHSFSIPRQRGRHDRAGQARVPSPSLRLIDECVPV